METIWIYDFGVWTEWRETDEGLEQVSRFE